MATDAAGPAGGIGTDVAAPSLWAQLAVLGVIAAGTLALTLMALNYTEDGRRFPLLTFGACFLLIGLRGVQLVVQARRLSGMTGGAPSARLRREVVMGVWITVLGTAVVLVGVLPGSVLFLAAYLVIHRPVRLWIAGLVVLGVALALRGVFVEILNLPFQSGLLLR